MGFRPSLRNFRRQVPHLRLRAQLRRPRIQTALRSPPPISPDTMTTTENFLVGLDVSWG